MAGAQQKSVLESRSLKRKRGLGLKSYVGPPSHVLLGVRISVFWPDDHAFYKVCRLHRQAVPLSALLWTLLPCGAAADTKQVRVCGALWRVG